MTENRVKILAIESSCDETAAAVISGDGKNPPSILSNIISSQIDLHAKTGGVVPEVASRAHMEAITPVITQALYQARQLDSKTADQLTSCPADMLRSDITHIAVTAGPGLIGSLLVGFNAAKSIAYALDKPIIPINHIEGHIYSALCAEEMKVKSEKLKVIQLCHPELVSGSRNKFGMTSECHFQPFDSTQGRLSTFNFPLLALVVSGGHTSLVLMKDHGRYKIIGETLDDAAGEAFDKVAKLLDLGYPGGPVISKLACQFRDKYQISNIKYQKEGKGSIIFPRPLINDKTFNFSFSGLKTAVLYEVKRRSGDCPHRGLSPGTKAEIAAAFEDAVADVLVTKTMRAVEKYNPKTVVLAGGVAANKHLRNALSDAISKYCLRLEDENSRNKNGDCPQRGLSPSGGCDINLLIPPFELCGDNAAMIGLAAYYHIIGDSSLWSWREVKVDSNWELG